MKKLPPPSLHLAMAAVATLCLLQDPVHADDLSELYFGSVNSSSHSVIPPNILFIIDTSRSMQNSPGFSIDPLNFYDNIPYDPAVTYPGECDRDHIYRRSSTFDDNGVLEVDEYGYPVDSHDRSNFQSCRNPHFGFPKSTLACRAALDAIDGSTGWWAGKVLEFRPGKRYLSGSATRNHYVKNGVEQPPGNTSGVEMDGEWHSLSPHVATLWTYNGQTIWRECPDDTGVHGWNDATRETYPTDATPNGYRTTPDSGTTMAVNSAPGYVLASGNFINWYRHTQTRLAAVQIAARDIVRSLPSGVNVGLMRFDANGDDVFSDRTQGGMVIVEFVRTGTDSEKFIDGLYDIKPWQGSGTPLAETLLEAVYVFRGDRVKFGAFSNVRDEIGNAVEMPSVPASRNDTDPAASGYRYYRSPIAFECQKNAIIYLSDGDPSSDCGVWYSPGDGRHLPGFANYTGGSSCGCACLPMLSAYLANEDLSSVSGKQTVTTHTLGFGDEITRGGQDYLRAAAEKGGGSFTMANSIDELRNAFRLVFREEIARNVSLSSPAISINGFNRMSHRNDLYFTLFDPVLDSVHWPGNLKKYKLTKVGEQFRITDANGERALAENSSQIARGALSFWTDPADPLVAASDPPGVDGNKTPLGGAASRLPGAAGRSIYTWMGDAYASVLSNPANRFETGNANITHHMLGLSSASAERDSLINFMRGQDLNDEDADGITNETRRTMGAAPHGAPSVVTYGDDEATATTVIYAPTNEGFLHAIDAETGDELWAFAPVESMTNFASIMFTPSNPSVAYGLDGSVTSYAEGTSATDRKWIFFGMRRGGSSVYAVDVTDYSSPKIKWRIQGGVTPGFDQLAQTWSDPRVGKLNLGGASTLATTPVLVLGGGYDARSQDGTAASSGYMDDTKGNAVYIVNADTGALLWRAGGSGSGANLIINEMKSSIPASIELKDKNGDGYFDLMYAVDLGGRIFRFDIDNTASTYSHLAVSGGMIASLGAQGVTGEQVDNRKFFAEPDVVLVGKEGQSYWAINVGSGDRERPRSNMDTVNALFSIKDPYVFSTPADYSYGITVASLYDATGNLIQDQASATTPEAEYLALLQSDGWMIRLEHAGEKSLATAKTFDFRVFFTAFEPSPLNTVSCNSEPGTARLYSLDLVTAGAVEDLNNDNGLTREDRASVLTHGTVPPPLTFMFIRRPGEAVEATGIVGRSDDKAPLGDSSVIRRTFWNIQGHDPKEQ